MNATAVPSICPICQQAALAPSGQTVDLDKVLARWEEQPQVRFPDAVRQKYGSGAFPEVTLWRCGACGFGRFEPAAAGDAGFYAAIAATDYYVADRWEFTQAARDLRRAGVGRVLDIGCGSGHFLRFLRQHEPAMDLSGHDLNEALLTALAAEGFGTLSGPLDELAARAGRIEPFDALCLFQVLEHAEDPQHFLARALALLRPGGIVVITTPNAAGPIRKFPEALTEVPPHHVTQWTEAAFRAGLPRFGLRVEAVRFEPLPDYLWESYLPVQWADGIWPATLFGPLAARQGLTEPHAAADFAARQLRAAGIRHLHGVPGHTIYVQARREEDEHGSL